MAKYRIIFEGNKMKSCKRTVKFIGDKEKDWEMDYSVTMKKDTIEVLVNAKNQTDAISFSNDLIGSSPALQKKSRGVFSFGGSIK